MPAAKASAEKALCFDYLDRNAKAIATLNDSIFYFAELGMQEIETAGLMCDLLENAASRSSAASAAFPAASAPPTAAAHR